MSLTGARRGLSALLVCSTCSRAAKPIVLKRDASLEVEWIMGKDSFDVWLGLFWIVWSLFMIFRNSWSRAGGSALLGGAFICRAMAIGPMPALLGMQLAGALLLLFGALP